MSVLKNLRNLSTMQFYKNAINIRKDITEWMMRDFGTTRNKKGIGQVIKDIEESDQKTIDEIFAKYGKSPHKEFQGEYPSWFMEYEREILFKIMQELVEDIIKANSIYVSNNTEYELRRAFQDKAIGCCYALYQELHYLKRVTGTDLNAFTTILEEIEKEVDLIKGWRQSENKLKGNVC